jgi:rubrerythrin
VSFNSVEEILDFAIGNEKKAVAFYQDLSQREDFAAARDTYVQLAKEEKKHQTMLESFKQAPDKLSRYKYKWIPDIKRSNYMVDIEYEKGMTYVDILRLGMKREEKALALYNDLAGQTDRDDLIDLFRVLAQEEAKHKAFFETQYDDYMATQGD